MKTSKIKAWVVCCCDLHRAIGPFMIEPLALNVAKELTSKGGCVYIPVPIELEGQIIEAEEPAPTPSPHRVMDKDRGYL